MANTYTLINSTSLSTTAASVTFSSIPATYDDLVLQVSARNDQATVEANFNLRVNGLATSEYSNTYIRGNGSAASSSRSSGAGNLNYLRQNGSSSTSNTFASLEIYIPKYTSSAKKPVSTVSIVEDNASAAYIIANAGLIDLTSAVTSIVLSNAAAAVFQSGSTFWLYGIKNS